MPKSIEHYQQETGRAGRDGLEAECVLLYSAADALKWESLIEKSAAEAEGSSEIIQSSRVLLDHMRRLEFIRADLAVALLVAERPEDVLSKLRAAAAEVSERAKKGEPATVERM